MVLHQRIAVKNGLQEINTGSPHHYHHIMGIYHPAVSVQTVLLEVLSVEQSMYTWPWPCV